MEATAGEVYLLEQDVSALLLGWPALTGCSAYELQMATRSYALSPTSSTSDSTSGIASASSTSGSTAAIVEGETVFLPSSLAVSSDDKGSNAEDWVYVEKADKDGTTSSAGGSGDASNALKLDLEWSTLSSTLKATTIKKKNLSRNHEYFFRVRGFNSKTNDWSSFSTIGSTGFEVLSIDALLMDPPELDIRDTSSITVRWKTVEKCSGYRLRYRQEGDSWNVVPSVISNTQVKKKGLLPSTNYYFSVMPLFADASTSDASSSNLYQFSMSSQPLNVATISPRMLGEFPDSLMTKTKNGGVSGNPSQASAVELLGSSKVIGVYFSAHWCGPCRQFTPILAQMYNAAKKEALPFEIVFCSADHDNGEFLSYYKEMPWLAIPYDAEKREWLQGKHKVNGIPRLIIFDAATGEIIESNGRPGGPEVVRAWIQKTNSRSSL
jgi:thiol-disulfide isomerase/thioredoxin